MTAPRETRPVPLVRTLAGGFLMGLANLVPGVSGGTMILALGLYDRFIAAVADVTRARFSRDSLVFLALVVCAALAAILLLSGVAVTLVVERRWVMYSLFIGLALGGVPELYRTCKPLRAPAFVAFATGLGLMAFLAFGFEPQEIPQTTIVFGIVGALAASSMILPGISGSYVLLILGMYDLVIGSASLGAIREDARGSLAILVPVGVGAVLGIALLSNLLKFVLTRFSSASHALLLGLLCGSVLGLWPFQQGVHPELSKKPWRKACVMLLEGEDAAAVEAEHGIAFTPEEVSRIREQYAGATRGDLKRMSLELERFDPGAPQAGAALVLALAGFGAARLLGRRGGGSVDASGNSK